MSFQLQKPQATDTTARMVTSMGDICIRFFPEGAPKTVQNFTTLAKEGKYNGVTFHRVSENRQVGEPLLHIKPQLRPVGGTGIVIDMLQSHNQTVGFNIDYLHTFNTHFLANRWVISSTWKAQF